MSAYDIHRLAGELLLNEHARAAILSASRPALLSQFDLTPDECAAIEAARPATVVEALAVLESLAVSRDPVPAHYPAGRRLLPAFQTLPVT